MSEKELESKKLETLQEIVKQLSTLNKEMSEIKQALRNISNKDSINFPKYHY